MINTPGLCKSPNLKHRTDIVTISITSYCTDCDRLIEVRESISLNEMRQFRLGGKEMRSIKLEKIYEKLIDLIEIGKY